VGNPPTADFIWIPGTWIFRGGQFLWLAGKWVPVHPGWVWIPARYVWTPAGYVFVDGFWDFELAQRGVLFAPVCFAGGVPAPGFVFTPNVVLNTNLLTDCLFVNAPCGCYCFGDYYGANCQEAGIFPWFAFHMSTLGFDPIFACSSWAHRKDAGWHANLMTNFRALQSDATLRPPHTLDDLIARAGRQGHQSPLVALPLSKLVAGSGASSIRFEKLSTAERDAIGRSLQKMRDVANTRLNLEKKLPTVESKKQPPKITGRIGAQGASPPPHPPVRLPQPSMKRINQPSNGTQVAEKKRVVETNQTRQRSLTTTRTPPVVPRRPVSTAGLSQQAIQEHPAHRLANPRFVPQASNRGRPESERVGGGRQH
jgi:hypothetical protein